MDGYIFPDGKIIYGDKPFSKELFAMTLEELLKTGGGFHGFLRIDAENGDCLFLFFLKSSVFAAGRIVGDAASGISVRDFFDLLAKHTSGRSFVSLHETDPVLLKGLLVYIQKQASVSAPASVIELKKICDRIRSGSSDAFVFLVNGRTFNLVFFKAGVPVMSHFGDSDFSAQDESPDEQMISYSLHAASAGLTALLYDDTVTFEDPESSGIAHEDLLAMLYMASSDDQGQAEKEDDSTGSIRLRVLDGPMKGELLTAAMPCIIGRKDSDVVIPDPLISRRHAFIKDSLEGLLIEDLDSTNGTFLNGRQIKISALSAGDEISLGGSKLRVEGRA